MVELLPYQERVIEELEKLEIKSEKLKNFILGDPFKGIDCSEQSRMILQYKLMEAYAMVLEQRIEAFNTSN